MMRGRRPYAHAARLARFDSFRSHRRSGRGRGQII
jgi:hypothetical protein